MKNFWNIFLLSIAVIATALYLALEYLAKNNIETIEYDEGNDENKLSLYHEDRIKHINMKSYKSS